MLDLVILAIISIIIAIKYPWFGFYVFAVAYTYASYSLEATEATAFGLIAKYIENTNEASK